MCSPPAKRSSDATSARRGPIFVISSRLSSSFTEAVIAITAPPCLSLLPRAPRPCRPFRPPPCPPAPPETESLPHGPRERIRIMPSRHFRVGHRPQVRPAAQPFRRAPEIRRVGHGIAVRDHRVDPQIGRVLEEYVE